MKKNYSSPKMDYWCYIAGQLCDGVGAQMYARTAPKPEPSTIVGSAQ